MKQELDLAEVLARTGSKEWNECFSSRLEAMRGYLAQEAWEKGIAVYLRAKLGYLIALWIRDGGKQEYRDSGAADYLRGYAAAVEYLLALPASIDGQIDRQEEGKKTGAPKGSAGY